MAEYKDVELLKKHIADFKRTVNAVKPMNSDYLTGYISALSATEEAIAKQPTADVAPVRHGRWKKSKGNERPTENGFVHDDKYVCDCCGWSCCCETKLDFSFCPNYGARMDGDTDANGNDNKTPET